MLRFTKKEMDTLTRKAQKANMSREGFCRAILDGAEVKEAPAVDVALQMNKRGRNSTKTPSSRNAERKIWLSSKKNAFTVQCRSRGQKAESPECMTNQRSSDALRLSPK